jgi:transcriptional regulator with PAS, ATPase and Fis domain
MDKKSNPPNFHQRLEAIIREMVDREIQFKDARDEFEKIFIEMASSRYKGNKCKVAKAIGIHRNTLHSRAKALKIKSLI